MGDYTRKQFLEYYGFKDEPMIVPQRFHSKRNSYTRLCENIPNLIKESGVKPIDAFAYYGIPAWTYYKWREFYKKELKEGKTDTPLIRLFKHCEKGDANLKVAVGKIAMDKIYNDGDAETMRFVMKHRLGYNNKQEIEVSTPEDTTFNINIIESKPRDD